MDLVSLGSGSAGKKSMGPTETGSSFLQTSKYTEIDRMTGKRKKVYNVTQNLLYFKCEDEI